MLHVWAFLQRKKKKDRLVTPKKLYIHSVKGEALKIVSQMGKELKYLYTVSKKSAQR